MMNSLFGIGWALVALYFNLYRRDWCVIWLFARIVQVFQYTGQKLVDAGNFWALMFFIMALALSDFYLVVGYCSNRISLNVASNYRQEYFRQFAALVGASGCGKSTIISLLERFYQVSSGEILIGGENINSIDLSSYRSSLALVSQEPQLFDGTIRDNLLLGHANPETIPESQIVQACRDAEIHDFIASLPDGYNTALGTNSQAAMSGGQRQRVCIARALVRRPSVLLLDEATSSLDSQSERLVQGALERLAKKRDMIIITVAHRLATIQKANPIFVLGRDQEDGHTKVLESGSHAQLILKRAAYWEMCRAQALDRGIE
ncbi:hypothetical protein ASPVEDRAFT_86888 [Aspergillus versicolor CBS 583.65]|uniref:ABC transporter domain-containing protein n=1 Tax=Aspergillus versicolor CBS 583.65 TaxID=1036611 RepID=A0A1L9PVT1_ASPVE|nr:uncharacterized protein ASPVEDRAFT_86888 [Aspergillus versicolor CBS 583.65]OJJ05545.1 hypothetical protein ASPVEDRAFT_86888 [Aspergillus versicolor CBS 583.65]